MGDMDRLHLWRQMPSAWGSFVPMGLVHFLQVRVCDSLGDSGEDFYSPC